MFVISRCSIADQGDTYALSGEITVGEIRSVGALIDSAVGRGTVTLDVGHVSRIEGDAAVLLAQRACRPNNRARVVGLPTGLLEWLRSVSSEAPEGGRVLRRKPIEIEDAFFAEEIGRRGLERLERTTPSRRQDQPIAHDESRSEGVLP